MAISDGNGWVDCRCGRRHWGLHGAAGLLVVAVADQPAQREPAPRVLLQLRAGWTHQGGTWGLPGGARDSHEDVVAAALREAHEEVGVEAEEIEIVAEHPGVDHGDWTYSYVLAVANHGLPIEIRTQESDELRWVDLDDVGGLPLHPALDEAWPALRREVERHVVEPRGA